MLGKRYLFSLSNNSLSHELFCSKTFLQSIGRKFEHAIACFVSAPRLLSLLIQLPHSGKVRPGLCCETGYVDFELDLVQNIIWLAKMEAVMIYGSKKFLGHPEQRAFNGFYNGSPK